LTGGMGAFEKLKPNCTILSPDVLNNNRGYMDMRGHTIGNKYYDKSK